MIQIKVMKLDKEPYVKFKKVPFFEKEYDLQACFETHDFYDTLEFNKWYDFEYYLEPATSDEEMSGFYHFTLLKP
jgi:hypothetical protein